MLTSTNCLFDTNSLTESELAIFEKKISLERLNRAEKYVFLQDRRCCILAEILIKIACDQLNIPFAELKHNNNGKPYVLSKRHQIINCSITHSKGVVLVNVSKDTLYGVDLQSSDENLAISSDVFSVQEIKLLTEDRINRYELWSAKEAVSKLYGMGLLMDFSQLEFLDEKRKKVMFDDKAINCEYEFITVNHKKFSFAIASFSLIECHQINFYTTEELLSEIRLYF